MKDDGEGECGQGLLSWEAWEDYEEHGGRFTPAAVRSFTQKISQEAESEGPHSPSPQEGS